MPPLPLVAFDVIIARTGTPASVPAPTPTPTLVPTPGPCLTGASCTAIGAPCSSCRSLFIARRPMPATLRRVDLARGLVRQRHARLGHRGFLVERDLGGCVGLLRRRLDRIGLVVVERDRLLGRRLGQLGLRLLLRLGGLGLG